MTLEQNARDFTRISNAQRDALRKAVFAHPKWSDYRVRTGTRSASLSTGPLVDIAIRFGIDVAETIGSVAATRAENNLLNGTSAVAAPSLVTGGVVDADTLARLDTLETAVAHGAKARLAQETAVAALHAAVVDLDKRTPQVIEIQAGGVTLGQHTGLAHKMFATLARAATARNVYGSHPNVWIAGPAGSGKTSAAKALAATLGVEFSAYGTTDQATDLLGYVSPVTGTYQSRPFVERFRNGGVCLLDEIDTWQGDAYFALNAALANGFITLPTGEFVERHADFICIGAANTWGSGPTAEYIGRNRIDAAFLSRFAVKLPWEYDHDLERRMCGNEGWAGLVQLVRAKVAERGLKVLIDPRHSVEGAALLAAGFTTDETMDLTVFAGLDPDTRNLLRREVRAEANMADLSQSRHSAAAAVFGRAKS